MNGFLLLAQAPENPVQQIARTFGVDWPHLISQIISFCIVCALLYKFAYKRVLIVLETRRQKIEEGLANTEKIKTELANAETRRKEILDQANTAAEKLIEEAHAAAARVRETESKKALAAAEQIIAKAQESTERDHAKMLTELKREVGRLVVKTTETVTGKVLTSEDQKRLADETSRQLAANN